MTAALVAGLVAGYGIALPIGALGAYLVTLTASTSWRVGVAAALGVASADGLYALVAVAGGRALSGLIAPMAAPLRVSSAVVLVIVAGWVGVSAVRRHRVAVASTVRGVGTANPMRCYFGLLGLTLVNPTTVVYFAALVVGNRSTIAGSLSQQGVFVIAALVASASWQLLLAMGGTLLGRLLSTRRAQLWTGLISSGVIALLALAVVR